ncbi:MAG: cytochrome P450 [Deltaproteobacteria bacterium]|nr:cytochrome P450 [Deltaproteobacteria bacterium]MBW2362150.1 cytochrome P450 [Deltaproteobacteria bacterium]
MSSDFVYDPSRPDFPERTHEIYRTLRDEHPIYHNEEKDYWAVSRFEDVRSVASDAERFSSEGTSLGGGLLQHIQVMDPPRHNALRNLVSMAFTPRSIGRIEPRVRAIARELIDGIAERGSCDLHAEFARHLPSRVISEMIGVPEERRATFLECTEKMIEVTPENADSEAVRAPATKIYVEFAKLLEERRSERRDDLMSALLDAEVDGEHLTQDELLAFCFMLIVAGNDTTTNLIANGSVMLAHHPEQRRLLVADPSLIPNAVEEMLRYESPAQVLPRRTTEEIELHGKTIPAEQEIKLVWAAANRDEREFPDPDRFDIKREARRHLALGIGVHFCLGSKLARLEARVGFEELLARLPEYELESEPRWVHSLWARAYAGVPISF